MDYIAAKTEEFLVVFTTQKKYQKILKVPTKIKRYSKVCAAISILMAATKSPKSRQRTIVKLKMSSKKKTDAVKAGEG